MTELEALTRAASTYSAPETKSDAADGAFAEALEEAVSKTAAPDCAPSDVDRSVELPERWADDKYWGYVGAGKGVTEFLKAQGIDTENRVPTHEITDEQLEWLASRNDLEAIKSGGAHDTPELAQLFGDLIYLNVLSFGDVAGLMVPTLPLIDAAHPGVLIKSSENGLDYLTQRDKSLAAFLSFAINEHEFELGYLRKTESDLNYLQKQDDFIANERELLDVLLSLFGDDSENADGSALDIDYEALLAAHEKNREQYEEGRKIDIAIESAGRYIETRRKELEYLREKDYENILNGKTELSRLHDFLNGRRRFDGLLEELFTIFPPEVYAELEKVTDATDRLTEDFGGLL